MDEAFPTTLWWLQRTALVLEVGVRYHVFLERLEADHD